MGKILLKIAFKYHFTLLDQFYKGNALDKQQTNIESEQFSETVEFGDIKTLNDDKYTKNQRVRMVET